MLTYFQPSLDRFEEPSRRVGADGAVARGGDDLPERRHPDIARGEHVRRFIVQNAAGRESVTLHEGRNIGHKAICRFPLVAATGIRFEVTEADGPVTLRTLELHCSSKEE